MSKLLISLILGSILFSACRKESFTPVFEGKKNCELQTDNPLGRTYTSDSVVAFNCTQSHCGILPLNSKNYWIYEDSVFNNGVFLRVQLDTLRYTSHYKTVEDGLVWWESNISLGLPAILYASDSAFFELHERIFDVGILDARKDFSLFPGDSIKYLANFEDNGAFGRSVKLTDALVTPAGDFPGCILFEKHARSYRKDQVYFKPGLGVIRYVHEKATPGTREIKLQQVSTLVGYHIE